MLELMVINAGKAAYRVSTAFTRLKGRSQPKYGRQTGAELTHFFSTPPIFFMKTITSEWFKFPCVSVPTVSCILPYTCAIEADTKFPRLFEIELAAWSILLSRFRALVSELL